MIADFQVEDNGGKPRFFQKIFLVTDTKFEVVLGISFLKISNAKVVFIEGTLTWKSYTTNKALPTTKQVQLVNQKDFVIAALDADNETFVVHVAIRKREKITMDPEKKVQIEAQSWSQSGTRSGVQVGALIFNKAPNEVPAEYSNYSNDFSAENAVKLPENIGIKEHAIELEESKQPPFGPIYSLGPVELEILKTYIETNLANDFIGLFKSPSRAPILFDRKPDESLRLCIDYRGLNNIMIKNRYPLSLIGESFIWLGWARRFT